MAQTTNVPKTVRCEWEMTKSVKWVGCWSARNASSDPWKHPTRYMMEPTIRNLAGRFLPNSCHRPIMVPKKFWSTVQTGMISIIEETMAIVSAQSGVGGQGKWGIPTNGEKDAGGQKPISEGRGVEMGCRWLAG